MDTKTAAVELINVIRPTVAISWYITFAALALHDYPYYRKNLQQNGERYAELFINEVRRYYPFAPFMGARVRKDFEWKGYPFQQGQLVLLDIFGTNHDPRLWERPQDFWPERFQYWDKSPFDFLPQGGGDFYNGHRCAGEWITIEALKVALRHLTTSIDYHVPPQDLNFSLSRMPTYPKSGIIISGVRRLRTPAFAAESAYAHQ